MTGPKFSDPNTLEDFRRKFAAEDAVAARRFDAEEPVAIYSEPDDAEWADLFDEERR